MALTTDGISHQIVSSLVTYKVDKLGTLNDCKVVMNHLIRKFSEPLSKEELQQTYYSKELRKDTGFVKEHLVPVNEIMCYLLQIDLYDPKNIIAKNVKKYLSNALILVYITKDEDNILNSCGFQRKMPQEYFDKQSNLFNDTWARYKRSGIYNNIIH